MFPHSVFPASVFPGSAFPPSGTFIPPPTTAKGGGIWDWDWHDERRKKKREQLRKAREELGITPSEIAADEIVDTVDDYDEDELLHELDRETVEPPKTRRILSLKPTIDDRVFKSLDSALDKIERYRETKETRERDQKFIVERIKRRAVEAQADAARQIRERIVAEREHHARIERDDEEILMILAQLL